MSIDTILSDIHLVHYSLRLSAMMSVKKSEVNIFKFIRIRKFCQKKHTHKNQHYVKESFLHKIKLMWKNENENGQGE